MVKELAAAFLLTAGLCFVLWALFGLLLMPVFGKEMITLCYVEGSGGELEQKVRAYAWLREGAGKDSVLLLVDCGLSEKGLQTAQQLQKAYDWVCVCSRSALQDCLEVLEDKI